MKKRHTNDIWDNLSLENNDFNSVSTTQSPPLTDDGYNNHVFNDMVDNWSSVGGNSRFFAL